MSSLAHRRRAEKRLKRTEHGRAQTRGRFGGLFKRRDETSVLSGRIAPAEPVNFRAKLSRQDREPIARATFGQIGGPGFPFLDEVARRGMLSHFARRGASKQSP